jgi:hypothetical protein
MDPGFYTTRRDVNVRWLLTAALSVAPMIGRAIPKVAASLSARFFMGSAREWAESLGVV